MAAEPRRALVLQHDCTAGPGLIATWLQDRGITQDLVDVPGTPGLPDPRDYDLVVSLGSEHCAVDERLAWIAGEARVLQQAHAASIPVLGVCFGGQLLARALGGDVRRDAVCEVGWTPVVTQQEALVGAGPWFAWHLDSIVAPPAAEIVAMSAAGVQAFRCGTALGLQFHPEVTAQILDGWLARYGGLLDARGIDRAAMAPPADGGAEARRATYRLLDAFIATTSRCTRS